MPLYKEQGVVLRSVKLGEADKIVTVMTQGSGKVRAVAKGIRKTTSRFGARLEPFTHVSLMVYRGRGSLDTVSQAEIVSPFRALRGDLGLFAAGETMLEAVDKVAEEHERNVRLFMLLLTGTAGARREAGRPRRRRGVVPAQAPVPVGVPPCAHDLRGLRRPRPRTLREQPRRRGLRRGRRPRRRPGVARGARLPGDARRTGLLEAGDVQADTRVRRESRSLLFGFTEYHLERRMKSLPLLARSLTT